MKNEVVLNKIREFMKKPQPFNKEGGNIWTEEYIAKQMLKAHLDEKSDAASYNKRTIDNIVEFIGQNISKKDAKILDLGCGPGLYTERLCEKGYKVTGIDFSENTIKYAKDSARKKGLNIDYFCKNILELNYFEKYDVVIQIYGEINTFSDSERTKIFQIIKNALKPEGIFIFDVSTPTFRKRNGIEKNWSISEGGFWREKTHIILEEGFKYDNDIWLDQYIIIDDEDVQVYRNWFHDYTIKTISEIIEKSRFKIINVVGSLTGEPLKEESDWIGIVAEKYN